MLAAFGCLQSYRTVEVSPEKMKIGPMLFSGHDCMSETAGRLRSRITARQIESLSLPPDNHHFRSL